MGSLPATERLTRLVLLIIAALCVIAVRRFLRWFRNVPISPDPWAGPAAQDWNAETATEVCHRCSQPHSPTQSFCTHCGTAVGPYNNCMPYVYLFSQGEVLRTGVIGRFRVNALTILGFLTYSLACYLIFAPIYWCFLVRNIRRLRSESPALDQR